MVIPFGLTNYLATFMNMMNNVVSKLLHKFVLVFIDDILVYSENEVEDEGNLRKVLETLNEYQLYAKLSKCDFYNKKGTVLGTCHFRKGNTS